MRKFVSISILAAVIIFWFVFAIHNSLAAPADFDPTFGANGKVVASMTAGGPAQINKIVIQPDGKILAASTSRSNNIVLLDVSTGTIVHTLSGHTEAVADMQFTTNGKLLVSSAYDETIRIWGVQP